MLPTDELVRKLRRYTNEAIPTGGSAADTAFSEEDITDLISDSEMLEKKYEMLQRIPEAQEYLRAETDLCVLLREICGQLTKEAGVRLPGKDYGGS